MADLVADLEWGTLGSGFAWVDGVVRETFPWYSRGGAEYVSSHGAIVAKDMRVPFGKPLKFLAPALREEWLPAGHWPEAMAEASRGGFAMAGLDAGRYGLFEDQTGLFREFALLRNADTMLAFANRFGPLGADASIAIVDVVPDEPEKQGLELYWAEPLSVWQAETQRMARAVGLWDLIREEGPSAFACEMRGRRAAIAITRGNSYIAPTGNTQWIIADADKDEVSFSRFADSSPSEWPSILLSDLVTEGLRGRVDAALNSTDSLTSTIRPRGLIGGLWLQAALAIGGDKELKRCVECGIWFEVATANGRSDKEYCSDACRMRAYRRRKKEKEA